MRGAVSPAKPHDSPGPVPAGGASLFRRASLDIATIVPSAFAIALAGVTAFFVGRSTAKSKAAEVWQSEAEGQKARGDRLQIELAGEKDRVTNLLEQNASLQARPTFDQAMNAFAAHGHESTERWQQVMTTITELIASHERRAEERHAALLLAIKNFSNGQTAEG